jgi:hypothetical protein
MSTPAIEELVGIFPEPLQQPVKPYIIFASRLVEWLSSCTVTFLLALVVKLVELPPNYIFGNKIYAQFIPRTATLLLFWLPYSVDKVFHLVIADIVAWKAFDEPNAPRVVSLFTLARVLGFFTVALWTSYDAWSFVAALSWLLRPALYSLLPCLLAILRFQTDDFKAKCWTTAIWMIQFAPYSWYWGAAAYGLSLWGPSGAFALYLPLCAWLILNWPKEDTRAEMIARFCLVGFWSLLYAAILLPFFMFWWMRQLLKLPYWTALERTRQWWLRRRWIASVQDERLMYTYTPLQPGEVRILEVNRDHNGEVFLRLCHVKLSDSGPYDAISYTWGTEFGPDPGVVIDDDKWISIRQNAFNLLHDRATSTTIRRIWLDCLCINQTDDTEKAIQIPLMAQIYSQAERTIVWLGEMPYAPQVLSLIVDLEDRPWQFDLPPQAPEGARTWLNFQQSQRPLRYSIQDKFDPRFEALAQLLANPWFYRVWILQEVIFSKKIHIRAAGTWIDWEIFATVMKLLSDPQTSLLIGKDALDAQMLTKRNDQQRAHFRTVALLTQARGIEEERRRTNQPRPKLSQLLAGLSKTQATKPQDMIYGLFNLCREAGSPACRIDYTITAEALYTNYTILCLQRNEYQDIIHAAGIGHNRKLNIPSWVPDWTSLPEVISLQQRGYRAAGQTEFDFQHVSPSTLKVKGFIVGRVTQMAPAAFSSLNFCGILYELQTIDDCRLEVNAQNLADELPDDYDGGIKHGIEPRKRAFWRTLIGDTAAAPITQRTAENAALLGLSLYHYDMSYTRPAPDDYETLFNADCQLRAQRFPRLRPRHWAPQPDVLSSLRDMVRRGEDPDLTWWASSRGAMTDPTITLEANFRFRDAFASAGRGRKFCIVKGIEGKQMMALVPPLTEMDDCIAIIHGLDTPFVLRRTAHTGHFKKYQLVGECYVHGIVDGEALERAVQEDLLIE